MDRVTRHDIKRNELQDWVENAYGWSSDHVRLIVRGLIAVLVAGLLVVGFMVWRNGRVRRASELLAQGERVLQAPIVAAAEAKPQDTKEPTFSDQAARQIRARELFERVHRSAAAGGAAPVAALYLADLAVVDGDLAAARRLWRQVAHRRRDSMLRAQAWQNLYNLDRQEGKCEGLVADLRAQLSGSNRKLPEDVLLWELAVTLEAQGQLEQARTEYQRLVDDHPSSPYSFEARQRAS